MKNRGSLLGQLGLTLYAISIFLPLVWVLSSSLKSGDQIFANPWSLPTNPQFGNYGEAWNSAGIAKYFLNSAIATVGGLILLIPIGAMAAYVFAKYTFRGSKAAFATFLGGMMFPNFLVVVPLFFLMGQLSMLDTLHGLIIVYVAYSLSFTIFVLTGFFQALPNELMEAAMLDGCGHSQTFWKVMMPLARPGLLVVAVFNGIGLWNEYPLALVLMSSDSKRTLPLGLADMAMRQQYTANYGALFAALVMVMLPVLLVYWIFRDRIHDVMLAGAVKG